MKYIAVRVFSRSCVEEQMQKRAARLSWRPSKSFLISANSMRFGIEGFYVCPG